MGHSDLFDSLTWSASIQLNERSIFSLMLCGGAMNTRTELSMSDEGGFFSSCNIEIQQRKFASKLSWLAASVSALST